MLLDLRIACRRLARRPVSTAVSIVLIGAATGTNTAVFARLNEVVLGDLPFRNPARLVRIWTGGTPQVPTAVMAGDYRLIAAAGRSLLDGAAAYHADTFDLDAPVAAAQVPGFFVTPSLFDVFDVVPRCATPQALHDLARKQIAAVLVRESFARAQRLETRCGSGATVTIAGRPHVIAGYVHDSFVFPDAHGPLFVLFEPRPTFAAGSGMVTMGGRGLHVVGRARGDGPIEAVAAALQQAAALSPARPVSMMSLRSDYSRNISQSVMLLQVLAGLLFLVTVVSVTQALMTEVSQRGAETAVRAWLGASPWQAQQTLVLESIVTGAAGACVAWGIHAAAARLLREFGPSPSVEFQPGGEAWVLCAGIALMAACIIVPPLPVLLRLRRGAAFGTPAAGAVERAGTARAATRAGQLFLAGQAAAMTCAVVVGSLLVLSSAKLAALDMGFESGRVIAAPIRFAAQDRGGMAHALDTVLAEQQGAAALASTVPLSLTNTVQLRIDSDASDPVFAHRVDVSERYFELLAIPVKAGRGLRDADAAGEPAAVVSESFASRFLGGRPLGRHILLGTRTLRVVGVVGDVRARGMRHPETPTLYLHYRQSLLSPGGAAGALSRMELLTLSPAVSGMRGGLSVGAPRALAAAQRREARPTWFLAGVSSAFGALTFLIGIMAVVTATLRYLAVRRVDLAVRLALGASPSTVRRLISRAALMPATAGIAAGLLLAFVVSGLLRQHLFGVMGFSLPIYAAAGGAIWAGCAAAMFAAAASVPALDPAESLRAQ